MAERIMEEPTAVGEVLAGKYRVERVLGQGGMGVVVAATHLQLGQEVALKFLLPSACQIPEAVARFLREARAAVQIHSEHVARVIDVGTLENGAPFMVMEFLRGADLGGVLRARGPLPIIEAVDYVVQACEAIAEAHALGIVHRDLKPANLFLTHRVDGSPLVKVLDFGISKALRDPLGGGSASLTATTAIMGSPQYMSPEQIRSSKDVDVRTDVWSLGIILHELLAGSSAFVSNTVPALLAMIVADPPTPIRQQRADVPPELEAVILRCLEKDRTRRFGSVAQLARSLAPFAPKGSRLHIDRISRILGDTGSGFLDNLSDPPGAPAPAQGNTVGAWGASTNETSRRRRGTLGIVAGVLVVGGAVAAGAMLRSRTADPGVGTAATQPPAAVPLPPPASPPAAVAAASAPSPAPPAVQPAVDQLPAASIKPAEPEATASPASPKSHAGRPGSGTKPGAKPPAAPAAVARPGAPAAPAALPPAAPAAPSHPPKDLFDDTK
jgi:serine/threonine protein kinase